VLNTTRAALQVRAARFLACRAAASSILHAERRRYGSPFLPTVPLPAARVHSLLGMFVVRTGRGAAKRDTLGTGKR
jgi:hypothetical protein